MIDAVTMSGLFGAASKVAQLLRNEVDVTDMITDGLEVPTKFIGLPVVTIEEEEDGFYAREFFSRHFVAVSNSFDSTVQQVKEKWPNQTVVNALHDGSFVEL